MPAILDAIPAPPPAQERVGAVLICDHAATASALAAGPALDGCDAEIYAGVATAILQHSRLRVILQARGPAGSAACGAAIERITRRLPDSPGRLQVIEAEALEPLLPGVDLLVSFASAGLIAGCRNGLKPVQIGRAVTGSAAFSHVFPGIGGFAEALAKGGLRGGLSLQEFGHFEEFCRRCSRQGPADDPIARACRPADRGRHRALRAIASAIANPFALWRLVSARFHATGTG